MPLQLNGPLPPRAARKIRLDRAAPYPPTVAIGSGRVRIARLLSVDGDVLEEGIFWSPALVDDAVRIEPYSILYVRPRKSKRDREPVSHVGLDLPRRRAWSPLREISANLGRAARAAEKHGW